MGIIKDSSKLETGKSIRQLYDATMASLASAKANKDSLKTQIQSMKGNPDYVQEDWDEVQVLVNNIREFITNF
jgi:hypothetical protein